MGRTISTDKKEQIANARITDPEAIGPILGEFIISDNIPVEAIASLLSVSEPTVYRWAYGFSSPRDPDKIAKIQRLLTVFRKAKRAKELPMFGPIKTRIAVTADLVGKYRPVSAKA